MYEHIMLSMYFFKFGYRFLSVDWEGLHYFHLSLFFSCN